MVIAYILVYNRVIYSYSAISNNRELTIIYQGSIFHCSRTYQKRSRLLISQEKFYIQLRKIEKSDNFDGVRLEIRNRIEILDILSLRIHGYGKFVQ